MEVPQHDTNNIKSDSSSSAPNTTTTSSSASASASASATTTTTTSSSSSAGRGSNSNDDDDEALNARIRALEAREAELRAALREKEEEVERLKATSNGVNGSK